MVARVVTSCCMYGFMPSAPPLAMAAASNHIFYVKGWIC